MNTSVFKIKFLTILGLALFLSSCGFHLKGPLSITSDYESIIIEHQHAAQISSQLRQTLADQSVTVSNQLQTNSLQILLEHETIKQRSVAIRNQENKAYEMNFSVYLTIKDSQENILREKQKLSVSKVYPYNSSQILSSINEENILHKELKDRLVTKILYILDSL